jgi:hypothetical protein
LAAKSCAHFSKDATAPEKVFAFRIVTEFSFVFENGGRDVPHAAPVAEIVDDQYAATGEDGAPGIADVRRGTVIADDDLIRDRLFGFGVEENGSDPVRRIPVTVGEKYPSVREL